MQPLSLKLINSKGIKRGLGLDSIEIDYSLFDPGLVLLFGPSGAGKTTIIDALHFYRFKDNTWDFHFFPDGYKEIKAIYKEHEYFAQIYESTASLFKDGVLLNRTKKVSEYDECVKEEFGDSKIFFKLQYAGKIGKNILDFTQGEKKQIILDYLLDYLKTYEQKYLPKLQEEYSNLINEINFLQGKTGKKEEILSNRIVLEDKIAMQKMRLDTATKALEDLLIYQAKYLEQEKNNETIELKISGMVQEINILKEKEKNLNYNILQLEERIEKEIRPLFDELNAYLKRIAVDATVIAFPNVKQDLEERKEKINSLNRELDKEHYTINSISQDIIGLVKSIEKLKKTGLPCTSDLQIKCPVIGFLNFEEKLADEEHLLKTKNEQLEIEKANKEKTQTEINSLRLGIPAIEEIIRKQDLLEQAKAKRLERDNLKEKAKKIKDEIENLKKDLQDFSLKMLNANDLVEVYKGKLTRDYFDKQHEINENEREKGISEYAIKDLENQIASLTEELNSIEQDEKLLIEKRKETLNYPLLIEFFGKNGGMVYEIQKAGENISLVANKLLENYENKGIKIEFSTLRKNKKGDFLEDFNVNFSINDSEWKTYSSGGESSLISNAIRESLNYIKQAHDYKTLCLDEMDGSIDVPQRINYIKLLEEGHKLNGRYFTFLISHTTELLPYIRQKIVFDTKKSCIKLEK